MRDTSSTKMRRLFLTLFFVYVSLATLALGLHAPRTSTSRMWLISDWLINYEGVFVRRGLPGEVALLLARQTHISPVAFVVLMYLVCFAVLLFAVWRLAMHSTLHFWVLALLLSPASLSFQLLHPQAGFRKEIIYLAALSLFLVLLQRTRLAPIVITSYLSIVAIIGLFAHEGLIVYFPYFFAALLISGRSVIQTARMCAIPFVFAIGIALLSLLHPGNSTIASGICSSLGYKIDASPINDICGSGAIAYLRNKPDTAAREVLTLVEKDHDFKVFPEFALFAFVPLFMEGLALARSGFRRELRMVWIVTALSFLCSFVLFHYGYDWGRWIYIHILSVSVLLLFIDGKAATASTLVRPVKVVDLTLGRRTAAAFTLLLYATLWSLPNNVDENTGKGYIGRVWSMVHHASVR